MQEKAERFPGTTWPTATLLGSEVLIRELVIISSLLVQEKAERFPGTTWPTATLLGASPHLRRRPLVPTSFWATSRLLNAFSIFVQTFLSFKFLTISTPLHLRGLLVGHQFDIMVHVAPFRMTKPAARFPGAPGARLTHNQHLLRSRSNIT